MTSIFEVAESRKLFVRASTYIPGLPKLYVSYFSITPEAALDMIMAVDEPRDRLDALRETMKAAIESGCGHMFLALLPDVIGSLIFYQDIRDGVLRLLADVLVFIGDATSDYNESIDLVGWINEVLVSIKMEESLSRSLSSLENVDGLGKGAHMIEPFLLIAEDVAERIEDPEERAWALAEAAGALARAGDTERARRVAENAMSTAEQIKDLGMRVQVLERMVGALARAGDTERARRVAENAVSTAEQITRSEERVRALAEAADALVRADLTDETLVVAEQIKYPGMHVRALAEAADALARAGLTDETLVVAEQIKRFWSRVRVLVEVVSALVRAGDVERARRVAENAMNAAEQIEDPGMRARALAEAADALARADAIDEAREIVAMIDEPSSRSRAQSAIIKVLAGKGSSDEAVDMLRAAIAEVEGFVSRQDAADCCATLAAACVDAADLLADSVDAEPAEREQWLGLARSALARSWLYGASVWDRFDVLLRVAPDLATRLVEERLLADPDLESPGGGAPSSR